MALIDDMSFDQISTMRVTEVLWYDCLTLGFKLSDGQTCRSGPLHNFNHSHTFDPQKKITRVDVVIHEEETFLIQINFYSGQELLVAVGRNDKWVKFCGGRVETFEIAADETLLGCELDYCKNFSRGVTWLKWKQP